MRLNVYNTRIMGRKAAQRAEALASSKSPHGLWEASERFRGGIRELKVGIWLKGF